MFSITGFTPIMDSMVDKYGIITASVFGSIWRYCQMSPQNECIAAIEKISARIKVSPRTSLRHIKLLCEDGYLEDLTPKLRNKPHTYRDTGKVKMGMGMTESHSHYDRESQHAMTESHSHYDRESHEDTIKIPSKIPLRNKDPHPKKTSKNLQSKQPSLKAAVKKKEKSPAEIHPAIAEYRNVVEKFPPKGTWPAIIDNIGVETENIKFWRQVVENYILSGWYYGNIKVMLEFYNRREIPGTKKSNGETNGQSRKNRTVNSQAQRTAHQEETDKLFTAAGIN